MKLKLILAFILLFLTISVSGKTNDTIPLNPCAVVFEVDTAYIILKPPPILNVYPKKVTNWSRIKDLFL